jgi:hypothetical protein
MDPMQFKLPPVEIPSDDPFRFDGLQRRASVEAVASLLDNLSGPFVLAIDSPWGTGKTTFVRMLKGFLELRGFLCLYFNAWETDFTTDPLIAFLGEMDQLLKTHNHKRKALDKTKKIATLIAKRVLPVAGKIATGGLLDLDSFTEKALAELVSDSVNDAVDAYSAEKNLIESFHKSLSEAVEKLKADDKKANLLVFVDEVDRCRPTFAVELLERIKHLFNVPNILFVVSLDKEQLAVSLAAVYGAGINSNEYLRRFIDIEYTLPKADPEAFTKHLFARFGFEEFFAARAPHSAFRYERDQLEQAFASLSDLFGLSLRAREQCFTMLRVAMMTTPENYHFYPFLITALVVLKAATPDVYKRYALEEAPAAEVISNLRNINGGEAFLKSRIGAVVEAYLIGAKYQRHDKSAEIESYKKLSEDQSASQSDRERASLIVKIVTEHSFNDTMPSLEYVVNKIELAAQFKD